MDAKHTPGPWFVEQIEYSRGLDTSFEVHVDGEVILQTIMREKGEGWRNDIIERDRANVTLAAASPELLAALAACVESLKLVAQEITKSPTGEFESWSHPANSIRMAERALAKAGDCRP